MNLVAFIPPGVTESTVHGLHQWDYGRKLEIHSDDLPALIEVHFACAGMEEAVVRSCSVAAGVAEAAIPDRCLEQTAPITAWVYEVGTTSGATIKTIKLTVTARTRPQPSATIPTVISDKYTEAVAAMNEAMGAMNEAVETAVATITERVDEAVEAIEEGGVRVDDAAHADCADEADSLNAELVYSNASGGDPYDVPISEAGVYAVLYKVDAYGYGTEQIPETTRTTVIVVPSTDCAAYGATSDIVTQAPNGDVIVSKVMVRYLDGVMRVASSSNPNEPDYSWDRIPIHAIYKLASFTAPTT